MSYKTDLHIHTYYSDGTYSPAEIIEKYTREEYDLIAITDHEVTDGIKEAREAAADKNIRIISGIELAADMNGREIHILGYYIDENDGKLKKTLNRLAKLRKKRNTGILKAFKKQGIDICEKDLAKKSGGKYVGKPDFARALVKKGYINEVSEAFRPGLFLESDEVRAVKKEKLTAKEAIELIDGAKGIAVLAHPCKIKGIGERGSDGFKKNFEELLAELKKEGLKGLECVYPSHSDEERLYFIDIAAKYHLHITEGSDFHGR